MTIKGEKGARHVNKTDASFPLSLPPDVKQALEKKLEDEGMLPLLSKGVLVAFSGGADSMLLLLFLAAFCREKEFPCAAMHMHHGIRGEEADRDAAFCEGVCTALDIPFYLERADIPAIARQSGEGLEAAARRVRYAALERVADTHGFFAIATAHNATDQAETVLFHMARGTALCGLLGIPAVRGRIIRPLLSLSGDNIRRILNEAGVAYVTDSTNAEEKYSRNFIRNQLMPGFLHLNPSFLGAVGRMTEALAADGDLLNREASAAFDHAFDGQGLSRRALSALHPAVFSRTVLLLHERQCPKSPKPEKKHLDSLYARLNREGNFSLAFPGGQAAVADRHRVYFSNQKLENFDFGSVPLQLGKNLLKNGWNLLLVPKNTLNICTNVYKMLIQRNLSSAKIIGTLTVRSRRDGDAYFYGGMTHKLKKLFSDAGIPKEQRASMPVVCDEVGIVWVPGFGVRDDGLSPEEQEPLYALYYLQ